MIKICNFGPVTRFELARKFRGRGFYWTTAYLVDGLLIDTGCARTVKDLLQALEPGSLRLIVNTHSHEDHFGANGDLQGRQPGLKIRAHPQAIAILQNPRKAQPMQFYRRFFWGYPKPCQAEAIADTALIETENHLFQVMYTPGHSPDHLCLYEPNEGWMFSGDLYIGGRDRALRQGSDIWQIIASLKKIAHLPIDCLFPGSAHVPENPEQTLLEKIAYLEEVGGRILELHRQGYSSNKIVGQVCGDRMSVELFTLGHFSRKHLVNSYLCREHSL
jgi:glyoxylase-like metal-dependent hydrolase (beta-lactamase superfamily II)